MTLTGPPHLSGLKQLLTKEEIINGISKQLEGQNQEGMPEFETVVDKLHAKHDKNGDGVDLKEFIAMAQDTPSDDP